MARHKSQGDREQHIGRGKSLFDIKWVHWLNFPQLVASMNLRWCSKTLEMKMIVVELQALYDSMTPDNRTKES